MQLFAQLADDLVSGKKSGDSAKVRRDIKFHTDEAKIYNKTDRKKLGRTYGQLLTKLKKNYTRGSEISFSYLSSNPNHNVMTEKGFFEIQYLSDDGWKNVYNDWDWQTKLIWKVDFLRRSQTKISWKSSLKDKSGKYRFIVRGVAIENDNKPIKYEQISPIFLLKEHNSEQQ